ncbi:MAG: DUF1641 domain-containing protein [Myxococcota bacterium]
MNGLDALSARMDRMEAHLERIAGLLARSAQPTTAQPAVIPPAAAAMASAEAALSAVHGAADVSARLAETLVRIGEPETLDAITRIAILAPRLEYAAYAVSAGPELLEEAMETAQHLTANAGMSDADIKIRVQRASEMLADLSRPESLLTVQRLGKLAPHLAPTASAAATATQQLAAVEGDAALSARLAETLVRIGEPETLDALTRIAILAPKLEYAAYAVSAGPELLEEAMEVARDLLDQSAVTQAVMQRRLRRAGEALMALSDDESIDAFAGIAKATVSMAPGVHAVADASAALAEVEGADALRARLTESLIRIGEPETLDALTNLAILSPKLEYAAHFAAAGPELLEEAMGTVKEWSADKGDLNHRAAVALEVLETLSQPAMLRALADMSAVLPVLARPESIQAIERVGDRLPELTGSIDIALHAAGVLQKSADAHGGLDAMTEPAVAGLGLLRRAAEPETLNALEQIIALAPRLSAVVMPLSHLLDEIDPVQMATLFRSANRAIIAAASASSPQVGALGLLSALRDPQVQQAVGFGVNLSRHFGAELNAPDQIENK